MTTLAIVNPTSLLGKELREGLDRNRELWSELRLLTADPESAGTLTDVRGDAAVVLPLTAGSLQGVDLAFLCGPIEELRPVVAGLPRGSSAILLAPDASLSDGRPMVAGLDEGAVAAGEILISPHPAVISLAHLLHPLLPSHLQEVVAMVIQPTSMRGEAGMDELFEQTRAILSFTEQPSPEVFGHQLAFNLLPGGPSDGAIEQLRAIVGEHVPVALQIVQGGVFHSLTLCAYLVCKEDPGEGGIQELLAGNPAIEVAAAPHHLGPIEAAARDKVLVGAVTPARGRPGRYWLWSVMDNLTRGGAINALQLAERILGKA